MPITVQDVLNFKSPPKKEKPVKKWLGSQTACDICNTPFTDIPWFVDGRTISGRWALMCPACFKLYHCSRDGNLGIGLGQKYDSTTKIKIDG